MERSDRIHSEMYQFAQTLFPICRSLTGEGVRQTLNLIKERIQELQIQSVASGTQCFDWEVPLEWQISDAKIYSESGDVVVDFKKNNLHVVGYSTPVDTVLTLEELNQHLFSLPELPDAIPYITSYYRPFWGFCLSQNARSQLKPGNYRCVIKSELKQGVLNYGEILIPGRIKDEIFFSTYICHPSMANNEISGPVVTTFLAEFIKSIPNRKYSYRLIFVPETIGAIVYLSKNIDYMKKHIKAGYVVTCIGDDLEYSYLASRDADTLADRVALQVLKNRVGEGKFRQYSYLDRGSDERQYCSPGVDLPVASLMRSKYGTYKEYHTSLDDLDFISARGLGGGLEILKACVETLEQNGVYKLTTLGEPRLGKRGLYPSTSTRESLKEVELISNVVSYADGTRDVVALAEFLNVDFFAVSAVVRKLFAAGLLKEE